MSDIVASAPGKFIVLGEHAVVYGKPAVALAVDRRFTCRVRRSSRPNVNGRPFERGVHLHLDTIIGRNSCPPVSLETESEIPSGSGLGSSAAMSSAFSAAVRALCGRELDEREIAVDAFEAEYAAQGRASPMDASASTHGGGVVVNGPRGDRPLWSISKNSNTWDVSETDVPEMTFVVGYTGIKAPTGPQVEKVRKYRAKSRFAAEILDEIGQTALEGIGALDCNDVEGLGRLMTHDHKLLSILGVSCKELNKLVNAAERHSYGAKLTGAGGGGSMVALTDDPEAVCKAIALRGGQPFVVRTGEEGVRVSEILQ
jgi:mevalonate kinase